MAAPFVKAVDVLRVAKLRPAYCRRKRVFGPRYRHNMNVIAHQTITHDTQPLLVSLLFEQLQIHMAIVIDKEHVLPIITTLGDMMSTPGHNCPR